jgi:hypothetical protein
MKLGFYFCLFGRLATRKRSQERVPLLPFNQLRYTGEPFSKGKKIVKRIVSVFFFLRISSPYNICCWYKTVNMCGTQPTLYKTARSRRTNKSIHNTSQSHFPRDTVAEIAMCFALMMLNAYAHAWPEYSRR